MSERDGCSGPRSRGLADSTNGFTSTMRAPKKFADSDRIHGQLVALAAAIPQHQDVAPAMEDEELGRRIDEHAGARDDVDHVEPTAKLRRESRPRRRDVGDASPAGLRSSAVGEVRQKVSAGRSATTSVEVALGDEGGSPPAMVSSRVDRSWTGSIRPSKWVVDRPGRI